MVCKLDAMHVQLGFSHDSARVLVHKQGLNSTYRLRALTNKNVDDICNVTRKPGGKSTNNLPTDGNKYQL